MAAQKRSVQLTIRVEQAMRVIHTRSPSSRQNRVSQHSTRLGAHLGAEHIVNLDFYHRLRHVLNRPQWLNSGHLACESVHIGRMRNVD